MVRTRFLQEHPAITRAFARPMAVVVIRAVCANVCYSFGYLFELLLERMRGGEVAPVGPTRFRHGLIFSVGLTLFPIGIAWLGYLLTAGRWLAA